MKKHVIWTNWLNLDDWREDLKETLGENATEEELYREMVEINDSYLDDVKGEFSRPILNKIIVIAKLGLWNGPKPAYKIIESGKLSDCFHDTVCDYMEWYVDGRGDFRGTGHHHDGTNTYLYREIKPEISDTQLETFCRKIYSGKVTSNDISRYTRKVGHVFANYYGW